VADYPIPESRLTGKPFTLKRLKELLEYDPVAGIFRWRTGRYTGQIAGNRGRNGRIQIKIEERLVSAHRLAWWFVTGEWPCHEIDHRDGDAGNNAWLNFRKVDRSQNMRNTRLARDNSSGHKGVSLRKDSGKWRARIGLYGKKITIGVFASKEEAIAAYMAAARELHGEFARLE